MSTEEFREELSKINDKIELLVILQELIIELKHNVKSVIMNGM